MTECGILVTILGTSSFLKESLSNKKPTRLAVIDHSESYRMTVKLGLPLWLRACTIMKEVRMSGVFIRRTNYRN